MPQNGTTSPDKILDYYYYGIYFIVFYCSEHDLTPEGMVSLNSRAYTHDLNHFSLKEQLKVSTGNVNNNPSLKRKAVCAQLGQTYKKKWVREIVK